LSDLRV
jgi:NAD(P)-dependent dehydrogenase (short-subunit alcohol dehydrogenase family)